MRVVCNPPDHRLLAARERRRLRPPEVGRIDQPIEVLRVDLKQDLAVLSIIRNPYRPEKWIVSCAGVRGQGTRALLEFLAVPGSNPELMQALKGKLHNAGLQALVSADAESLELEILSVTEIGL